jgi:hypothetical protein
VRVGSDSVVCVGKPYRVLCAAAAAAPPVPRDSCMLLI